MPAASTEGAVPDSAAIVRRVAAHETMANRHLRSAIPDAATAIGHSTISYRQVRERYGESGVDGKDAEISCSRGCVPRNEELRRRRAFDSQIPRHVRQRAAQRDRAIPVRVAPRIARVQFEPDRVGAARKIPPWSSPPGRQPPISTYMRSAPPRSPTSNRPCKRSPTP